jgi:uncharacterized membrane protein YfcA
MIPVLLGIGIGAVMGLTGAGGGILAVPALVFFLGLPLAEAAPVALVAVALAGLLGTAEGLQRKLVRYRAAIFMAVIGMSMSPLGLKVARVAPERVLLAGFAAVMVFVAWRMLAGAEQDRRDADVACHVDPGTGRLRWTPRTAGALALIGGSAGFLTGLLGVGGGFLIVPALRRASDISMQGIVATSIALITLVATGTVVTALLQSHPVPWGIAAPFAGGAMAGMLAGRYGARRLPAAHLQRIFGVVAAVVAVALLVRAFGT